MPFEYTKKKKKKAEKEKIECKGSYFPKICSDVSIDI